MSQSASPYNVIEGILTFSVFFVVCVVWYALYIRPVDAARDAVMDCMVERGDLHSRDAYDACVADLRGGG